MISTVPRFASMVEPSGMPWIASRSSKRELPGRRTRIVPRTLRTTTVLWNSGVGVGVAEGVGVGTGVGAAVGVGVGSGGGG